MTAAIRRNSVAQIPDARIRGAESQIAAGGHRATPARARVLAVLTGSDRPVSHHEVEQLLARDAPVDRVTVYRVLEWLTGVGLAHKIAGDDRIWRYKSHGGHGDEVHAHFKCNRCGAVFCLEDMSTAYALNLPPGYRSEQVELTIRGRCADCSSGA
ncbi:MAG: Fur family transcriptional regulator [Pseudomonadota bacterium]